MDASVYDLVGIVRTVRASIDTALPAASSPQAGQSSDALLRHEKQARLTMDVQAVDLELRSLWWGRLTAFDRVHWCLVARADYGDVKSAWNAYKQSARNAWKQDRLKKPRR